MGSSGDFRNNEVVNKILRKIKDVAKTIVKKVIRIFLPIILTIIIISASVYYIVVWVDGAEKDDDWSSPEYVAGQYISSININDDGTLSSNTTAQELWDKMKDAENRAELYLDTPEELLKLMNAEMVTQFLDMRENPNEPIDWDKANDINNTKVQGIIKLKRADYNGNEDTMIYTDPETFQRYIDRYNQTGSESDKKEALRHFTLEKILSSSYLGQTSQETIEAGTTINIPSGLGSVHTYMGWQKITSKTSTQYKLREQAGMNFDTEGFGKINGRYVIACTATFGGVGDYIDFYQEDGSIIPCIIGDIKSQGDEGCTQWGHLNGRCIIEFVVNKDTWYNPMHANPGTSSCHPEWNKNLVKAVNGGSYFSNPNFGTDIVTENGKANNTGEEKNNEAMKWPTDGTNITSKFGDTEGRTGGHKGIDIGVPQGTKVYACEAGKVETSGWSETAGNWIIIDHGNGYKSKYMHNSELKVVAGDNVEKGQLIALSGNTGRSTGPHVHFQIEYNGTPVDPQSFSYDNGQGNGSNNGGIGSNLDNANSSDIHYCAKVATWREDTNTVKSNDSNIENTSSTTYSMSTTNINYQELVKGYTMPFDYLWALLVMSENKEFVLNLADLVYNSDIEITVHDNLTINTSEVVDKYTKKTRTDTKGKVTVTAYNKEDDTNKIISSKDDKWSDEESNMCSTTYTTVSKTNTLDYKLTKANVWIVDYSQEFTYQKPDITTTNNQKNSDDKDYGNSPDSTSNDDTYGHVEKLLKSEKERAIIEQGNQNITIEGKIDYIETEVYNAMVDISNETRNTTETTKYIESPAKIIEKTNSKSSDPNFVTLFLSSSNEVGRRNILSAVDWLYEIIENNPSTKDYIDLTKYLLYKATQGNIGKSDYDFSIYKPSEFTSVQNNNNSVTGNNGKFVRYYQGGQSWSGNSYGNVGTIAQSGCGACALAMAVTGLTGENVTPDIIVNYLNLIGVNTVYNGAESSKKVAERYKLTYQQVNRNDKASIDNALNQGKVCIFSIKANGIYRGNGHFIMCYKKDNSEGYYVLESGRFYNENKPYSFNEVFSPGNQGVFVLGK